MAPRPEFRLQERGSDPATQGRSPSILELSDTKVYEPQMRALLGTASPFCETIVLRLRKGRAWLSGGVHVRARSLLSLSPSLSLARSLPFHPQIHRS